MPTTSIDPPVASINGRTQLGRRLTTALGQLRSARDAFAGLDRDVAALFAQCGFDPANPTEAASAAVAAAVGIPATQIPAALDGLAKLRALDMTGALSRFTSPMM